MQTVYITIGLPGAGKSSWAKCRVEEDEKTVIVNRDAVRSMLSGTYRFDTSKEDVVTQLVESSVRTLLRAGYDLILDETALTRFYRDEKVSMIRRIASESDLKVKIVLVHFKETQLNVEHRMNDPRGLSRDEWIRVIKDLSSGYEPPQDSETADDFIRV